MRRTLGFGFLCLTSASIAQIPMNLYQGTKKIGEATYRITLTATAKTTTLETFIGPVHERETVTVDLNGQTTSTVVEQFQGKATAPSVRIVFSFDAKGNASATTYAGGRTLGTKQMPFPRRGSRKDVSEFWFIRQRPSPGTWSEYYVLDVHTGKWELNKTTYVGKKPVVIGGKSVMANKLTQTRASGQLTIWLDDRGNPLRIDTSQVRLEKR